MTLLNRPSDGLLSVLIAIRNALLVFGAQSEVKLLELAAPPTVTPDGKSDMARKTLTRWIQLGLFVRNGEKITLTDEARTLARDDIEGLRSLVLRLLLMSDNNPAFETRSGDDEQTLASDWTRAAAWILAQDPYQLPTSFTDIEHLQNVQGITPKPFINDTRWAGFVDWARFAGLGYATQHSSFVLNPAVAVRSALPAIFEGKRELSQADFLRRLQTALPVLDGGTYRVAVERQIARNWTPVLPHQLSRSLSAALLTLEASRDVMLDQRSDAPQCTLIGRDGRSLRQVSHFVFGQP
ncbi:MAG TPA: protein DpdG [Gemmatimonadaceae bacterium]|nr:protein DpdG [Gemmatimonadaceae bacterium]